MTLARFGDTAVQRFWNKVERGGPDDCWPWTGSATPQGYGWLRGRKRGPQRIARAHRFSYELATGADPGARWVLHRCDNPRCVNPAHLFLGTVQDNTADMMRKGRDRHAVGSRHHNAKLTEARVVEARAAVGSGESVAAVARRLGVSANTLSAAVDGRQWRHVRAPVPDMSALERGERHHGAKLNADAVREIRRARAAGETFRVLAQRFRVSEPTIVAVALRRTWTHVPD